MNWLIWMFSNASVASEYEFPLAHADRTFITSSESMKCRQYIKPLDDIIKKSKASCLVVVT